MIINIARNNKLTAYPLVNQKYILNIAEINNIAHTSIEKLPIDFL